MPSPTSLHAPTVVARAIATPVPGAPTVDRAPSPCPSCGASVSARFCGACGEKRAEPGDLALRHLAGELLEHATSLDSRLLRTLVQLVRRPGLLVCEYVRGARSPYLRPLQLYLLVNVAFFFLAPRLGIFEYHLTRGPDVAGLRASGSPTARHILRRIAEAGGSVEQVRAAYNAGVDAHMSVVFGLVVPIVALVLALLHARTRRPFVQHLVLAVHLTVVTMLALGGTVGLARAVDYLRPGHGQALFVGALLGCLLLVLAHVLLALRRVYAGGWTTTTVRALAVTIVVACFPQLFFRAVSLLTWWRL